jgi:glycogen debranching enzyme
MTDVDRVYAAAVESLRRCCHPKGLKASGDRLGHHQVWARDSMIAVLGGVLTQDPTILNALRASVRSLTERQAPNGCIPNNVDAVTGKANFRAYADGGLWWIIGSSVLGEDANAARRAVLHWYRCQDVDQSGLISMQESADWQDLFCTRGKGLYLNCLYVLALKAAGMQAEADRVAQNINRYFWYAGDGNMQPAVAHTFSTDTPEAQDSLGRKRWLPEKRLLLQTSYYLPYLAFRTPGEWFDTLGHLLAILAGVADEERTSLALDFIARNALADYPAKSLYPHVLPGDPDWRDYYGMLNTPDHYHNGGIWPFIGGFYVAALVHAGRTSEAAEALHRLAALNEAGDFNEWHHGSTGDPMGVRDQAWSSAMYIYAWHAVRIGKAPALSTA